MATKSPIKYRDVASQELVVRLLSSENERQAFLRDRQAYMEKIIIPRGARNALLQLTDEQITNTAVEFNYNFSSASAAGAGAKLAARKPRTGCDKSTFADTFCDG